MTTTKTTTSLGQQIADQLPGSTTHTNRSGDLCGSARNGSKRVTFREQGDGSVAVVLDIDHGVYGASWCGSNTYRTAAGALRYARRFLGPVTR